MVLFIIIILVFVSRFFDRIKRVNKLIMILAWCQSSCPGFCDLINGYYQCNCSKIPGYQLSNNGQSCSRMKKKFFFINSHL